MEKETANQPIIKVFMGGTCNGSLWRDRLISMSELPNISWFNPVVEDWNEAAQAEEIRQREICDICLYTITPKMIGTFSIAEAVDDSNKRPDTTALVLLDKDDDIEFDASQWKSLINVGNMVERNGGCVSYGLKHFLEYLEWLD